MDNIILCGMQFGDEGKGSFTDWIVHERDADCIVRYNGGCHASHTVQLGDGTIHKFAQLGSGMFKKDVHTYITKEVPVNPDSLLREVHEFSRTSGEDIDEILSRIHIHKGCLIVTPYHKLVNWMRELSLGDDRRGSVGTGVSEVPILKSASLCGWHKNLGMSMDELYNGRIGTIMGRMESLQEYASDFYEKHKDCIWENCPEELREHMEGNIHYLLDDKAYMRISSDYYDRHPGCGILKKCLYSTYEETIRTHKTAVWEGAQGVLLDREHGIAPNTTNLVTTHEPALNLMYLKDRIEVVGIAKAFCSRHGMGVFPTEDKNLNISDKNQMGSFWNGNPRYGWFDAVLFKYANRAIGADSMFLSCMDELAGMEKVKICHKYKYHGKVDDGFSELFAYVQSDGYVYITDIKKNAPGLKEYLVQCTPEYFEAKGWVLPETANAKWVYEACGEFIRAIEDFTGCIVEAVSFGPTRHEKIRLMEPDHVVIRHEYFM